MSASLDGVLRRVINRVSPTGPERAHMDKLFVKLSDQVERVLTATGLKANVSIQGSVARDTWLHGDADLDIFARFATDVGRGVWEEKFLPELKKSFAQYPIQERYAEHPFLELQVEKVRVNIVPCYEVERGKWKSATDRTPFHTEYMKNHLSPELKSEIRTLKQFMKGIGVYGAEIRIGGFSGMLVETLILRYRSFLETLTKAAEWKARTAIEVEHSGREERELREKFDSPLIVIDPVDPNRNLAAAVRRERLWEFVSAGREFLNHPRLAYFYQPKARGRSKTQLRKRISQVKFDLVVTIFPHPPMIPDILWGQLYSLESSLVGLVERHQFRVLRSAVWADAPKVSGIMMAIEDAALSESQLHLGPPSEKKEESSSFLTRHLNANETVSGPWIHGDRWMVEKRRQFPMVSKLIIATAKDPSLGLSVPTQLDRDFRRKARVLLNQEVLTISHLPSFAGSLWKFMDGRPTWLKNQY